MHPAVLLAPVAIALGGLVAAVVLQGTALRTATGLMVILWILWGILLVRAVWAAASWAVDYFVVTSQRMILTSGLHPRRVAMMPLNKVTDMSCQRSFAGRLFGYGEFIIESAGQDQALRNIPYIPYPEQLYLEVCNLLFPGGGGGDDSGSQPRYPGPPLDEPNVTKPLDDPNDG
jgi:uncharacterized membrane protein YdbT with pleckstrin-like domain